MTPGPDYIYECPHCSKLFKRGSLASGNTLYASLFSDGKRITPMLPEFPVLTKCEGCDAIIDIGQLKEIGVCDWGTEEHKKYRDTPYAEFLGVDDLYRALKAFPEQEEVIRQKIWWASNDLVRDRLKGRNPLSNEEQDDFMKRRDSRYDENCRAMLKFLDPEDQNQRITMAELYRNLGDFDKCMELMESVDGDSEIKAYLKTRFAFECERGNKFLLAISGPAETPEERGQSASSSIKRTDKIRKGISWLAIGIVIAVFVGLWMLAWNWIDPDSFWRTVIFVLVWLLLGAVSGGLIIIIAVLIDRRLEYGYWSSF